MSIRQTVRDGTNSFTPDQDFEKGITNGICIGVSGDLSTVLASGETVIHPALAAGIYHPIEAKQITTAGTDPAVLGGTIALGYGS